MPRATRDRPLATTPAASLPRSAARAMAEHADLSLR